MKFQHQYTKDDLVDFQRVVNSKLKTPAKSGIEFIVNFVLWILISLSILTTFSIFRDNPEIRGGFFYIGGYLVCILAIVYGRYFYKKNRINTQFVGSDGLFYALKEIEIQEDKIVFTSKFGIQIYFFSACQEYIKTERNHLLFVDNFQAILVPVDKIDKDFFNSKFGGKP